MRMIVLISILFFTSVFCELPTTFTWANKSNINYVPHPRNQHFPQVCNSGWAISAANVLSSRIKINSTTSPDVQISPQVLLECDNLNFGCYGGDTRNAFRWISQNNITDETCNPYKANSSRQCSAVSKCQFCSSSGCSAQSNSKIYGINTYGNIGGVDNMMNEIYSRGPIACGIALTTQLKNYTKGIFNDTTNNRKIQTFVMVYGWGVQNGVRYWNVLNNWGSFWGETGSFRIVRGQNNLGIQSQCSFANPIDTWTNDTRNHTPGTTFTHKPRPQYLVNSSFLGPHRNSHAPTGCSSSWALAVTTTLSDRIRLASKGMYNTDLSPQVLLNCKAGTCSTGTHHDAIIFISKYGIPEQSCQNYLGQEPGKNTCTDIQNCATCSGFVGSSTCSAIKSPKRWRIPDYGALSSVSQMKEEITKYGPIVCGIQVTSSFFNYQGGIFSEISILTKINHYVELIGFDSQNGKQFWIGRNFWGSAWGESGFFRISMHSNNLGVESSCYWTGVPK